MGLLAVLGQVLFFVPFQTDGSRVGATGVVDQLAG
jgi:hypothetical protein